MTMKEPIPQALVVDGSLFRRGEEDDSN